MKPALADTLLDDSLILDTLLGDDMYTQPWKCNKQTVYPICIHCFVFVFFIRNINNNIKQQQHIKINSPFWGRFRNTCTVQVISLFLSYKYTVYTK